MPTELKARSLPGTVHFYDFTSVAEIQMYDDWAQLREGYSKNIYNKEFQKETGPNRECDAIKQTGRAAAELRNDNK